MWKSKLTKTIIQTWYLIGWRKSFKKALWIIYALTHWGRVTHICVSELTTIGSDNGLPPGRRQAIIWTNVGILLFGTLGTNFSELLIEIHTLSFKKIHLKMSSEKWQAFCLGLNVLNLESKSPKSRIGYFRSILRILRVDLAISEGRIKQHAFGKFLSMPFILGQVRIFV